jgi:hypothetical protein
MTVQFNWPSDVVDRVKEAAQQKGLSLDEYVLQAIHSRETPSPSDDAATRQAREDAGRSIRELRKGNILGPDLSIRNLIEEGRRF